MPTDATGTPTSLGIRKYNTSTDAPSGLGFNGAMDDIDALLVNRVAKPSGITTGEFPVWNGTTWVRSSTLALSVLASGAYGTSLPGSPIDGQIHTLVDSTTVPTYQWTFRYNAGSSTTYKWEFVGGTYLQVSPATFTVTVASTYQGQSGANVFTAPRAGVYYAEVVSKGTNGTATNPAQGAVSFWVNGAQSGPIAHRTDIPNGNGVQSLSTFEGFTLASVGGTIGIAYFSSAITTFTYDNSRIRILPRMVS